MSIRGIWSSEGLYTLSFDMLVSGTGQGDQDVRRAKDGYYIIRIDKILDAVSDNEAAEEAKTLWDKAKRRHGSRIKSPGTLKYAKRYYSDLFY